MAEYINPQWRLPNEKTGNNSNYSMDFTMGTGVNFGSLSNILGNGIITYNTSYSVWIKPDFSYDTNTYQTFFGNFASGNNVLLLYYAHDINAFKFAVGDGSGHNFVSSQAFTSDQELGKGEWQHHCVSFDTVNNNAYYYIDNVQVNTSTGLSRKIATNQNFYIGKKWDLTSGGFTGEISQGCIFKYALPPTGSNSVAALWNGGNPGNPMALSSPPVAYYPLGNSAHMGSNYLTPNGALQDYVFYFNGGDDYINSGSTSYLNGLSNFTFSSWVNISSFGGYDVIAGDWSYSATASLNKGHFIAAIGTNNGSAAKIRIFIKNAGADPGSSIITTDDYILNTGKWYHVLFTYNSGTGGVYVNGVPYAVTSYGTIPTSLTSENSDFIIGKWQNVGGRFFPGYISNVQIFNTALTDGTGGTVNQIETLYNYGSPIQTLANIPQNSNLKAWYKLDASEIYNNSTANWEVNNALSSYNDSLLVDNPFGITSLNGITMGSYSDTAGLSAVSWSLWVNLKTLNSASGYSTLINGNSFLLFTNASNGGSSWLSRFVTVNGNINNTFTLSTALQSQGWVNIIATYDGANTKFYLNTAQQGTQGTGSGVLNATNSLNLAYNYGSNSVDARFSNFSIWNKALTTSDISEIYNTGVPGDLASHSSTSNLINWWKLNNLSSGLQDSKGSSNATTTGTSGSTTVQPGSVSTLNGESWFMTQANLVQSDLLTTSSYSPYALSFSGDGSYIDLNSDITLTGNKSVSFWVNFTSTISGVVFGGASAHYYPFIDATNIWIRAGGDYTTFAHGGLTSGVWYNICITGDGTNATAYLNGSSLGTQTDRGFTIKLINGEHTGIYGVDGKLSNCAIWNTVLTSSQVREIYNEGLPSNLHNFSGTAPVAWWQLGENSSFNGNDWIVADEIGSNNGESDGMGVDALTNGVGTTANGTSTGMSEGSLVGDAPYSTANAISSGMPVTARGTDVPPTP